MAINTGVRTTNQSATEERIVRSVYPDIALLDPDKAPLVTLLMKVKKSQSVDTPRLEWYEDDYVPRWGQNAGVQIGNTAGDTAMTVADGTIFKVGDLFVVPKVVSSSQAPEVCRVTARNGNDLTILRQVGGSGIDVIPANAALRIIGSAYEENSALPTAKFTSPAIKRSYLQIFRTVTNFSNTAIATKNYGAPNGERKREHKKKLVEHKEGMNSALLFGRASETLSGPNGNPLRTTQGILPTISSNKTDGGGTLTRKKFDEFARMAFRYGNDTKILLSSPTICSAINEWAINFLQVTPATTKYGVKIQSIDTAYGTFVLVRDWMLENGVSGQNGFGNIAMAIDLDEVHYRYLAGNGENRDTAILQDVVKDGTDGKRDEIRTEGGFMILREKYHALLYNVTDWMQ